MLDFNSLCVEIGALVKQERLDFTRLGFLLEDLNDRKFIRSVFCFNLGRNCKNIYELAWEKFNLKRSNTKRFIAIAKKFGERKGFIVSLKEDFVNFNYSQLVEMLSMSDALLQKISPDMTVAELRALKKNAEIEPPAIMDYDPMQFYPEEYFKTFSKPELLSVIMQLQDRVFSK